MNVFDEDAQVLRLLEYSQTLKLVEFGLELCQALSIVLGKAAFALGRLHSTDIDYTLNGADRAVVPAEGGIKNRGMVRDCGNELSTHSV